MLLGLSIRDFVIVDTLELEFEPGFTVLTGETGAGKSILIDALLLALGERADASVVREGASRADVTASFRPSAEASAWLAERDLDDGDALLLRRTVDAAGRGKAYVNGRPATAAQLRELGELLVDVHGQHAHQSLLRPAAQLQLLDAHGECTALAREVAECHARWRRAQRALEEAQAMGASAEAERQRLHWIVEELERLQPQPGEWDAIQAEHKRLSHAAGLREGCATAADALDQADDAVLARLDAIQSRIGQLAGFDPGLQPVHAALETARIHVDEAARELKHYLDRADLDEARLAEVDARVSALHGAARRLRAAPEALAALLQETQHKLSALQASADLARLDEAVAQAERDYRARAEGLSERRRGAAGHFAAEVTRALQDLAMQGGRLEVALQACEPQASGLERVEFLVAGHAGVTPRPLAKVASGGELARISLAIAVIAATATPVATLVFDEVDSGIGGAVAETVGRLLRALGRMRQVFCVTHLPQVAALGDRHFVVSKESAADGRPVSRIEALERRARVEEVARMLGGIEITDASRKRAREMLAA